MSEKILTVKEVSEMTGASVRTVRYWIERGYFPGAFKLDPNSQAHSWYRVPLSEVQSFLRQRQVGQQS
jgi:predicted DNA-binding transcriptional regulator AlpA